MTAVLIIGESGTGKTTSLRNLNPKETFIIGTINKPLPFKNKGYKIIAKEADGKDNGGNICCSDDSSIIVRTIDYISSKRPDIKTIVIDDFQYLMANEFMNRVAEKGYDKFSEIGKHAFDVINASRRIREDINLYILGHSDTDQSGKSKCKTIGKMLDDKVCLEGIFTIVLHSMVVDNHYVFLTQNNGMSIAKSPMGMFNKLLIDNDLKIINDTIKQYYQPENL